MKIIFRSFALIAALIFFESCLPSKEVSEERILPSDRLVKKLEGNRRKIKTFNGKGVLNVVSNEFKANTNFEVLIKKPDSVRVSIYGPFGIDLAHALVTDREFAFYDVMRKTVYRGENDPGMLQKIFKVDISFNDLIDAFAGSVNLTDKLLREPDKYNIQGDNYIMTYTDSTKSIETIYQVNRTTLALEKYILKDFEDNIFFEGEFNDFRMFDEVPIPYITNVSNRINAQSLNVEYRNITVNKVIEKINFNIPKDIEIVEW